MIILLMNCDRCKLQLLYALQYSQTSVDNDILPSGFIGIDDVVKFLRPCASLFYCLSRLVLGIMAF